MFHESLGLCVGFNSPWEAFRVNNEFDSSASQEENYVKWARWSPDGSAVLSNSCDNTIRLFSFPPEQHFVLGVFGGPTSNWPCVLRIPCPEVVYDTAWYPWMTVTDPASRCFLCTGKSTPIHLRDATTGLVRASYVAHDQNDEPESALSVAWSHDGVQVYGGCDGRVRVWDLQVLNACL
jgi:WD40 repeat protein